MDNLEEPKFTFYSLARVGVLKLRSVGSGAAEFFFWINKFGVFEVWKSSLLVFFFADPDYWFDTFKFDSVVFPFACNSIYSS